MDQTKAIVAGVLVAAALILAWQVSHTLLVIFAGVLIAAVLDAAVRTLGRVAPLPRPLLLAIVSVVILVCVVTALSLGGVSLWRNVQDLWSLLIEEANKLFKRAQAMGFVGDVERGERESILTNLLPDPGGLFNQASSIFGSTIGVIGDVVVVVFLGLFFAISPASYRDGFLLLLPRHHRPAMLTALSATGEALRGWMVTQLAMMILIGVLVFLLLWALDVPNAGVLGILAGTLNFVPFLGPIFSSVPVLLTLAAQDMQVLVIGAIGLFLIQNLEGYILSPMLQQRIIKLHPAWSLATMAVLGSLFGLMGIALATPIYAVVRTMVLKLFIEPREAEGLDTGKGQSETRSSSLPSEVIL